MAHPAGKGRAERGVMLPRHIEIGRSARPTVQKLIATPHCQVGLLRQCYGQLRDAEQRVKLLAGVSEEGGADLKPFDHVPAIDAAKAAVRKPAKLSRDPGIPE